MGLTEAQAIDGLMHVTARLGRLLMWTILVTAHLAIAVALMAGAWWLGVTPAQCAAVARHIAATSAAGMFVALGGSIATLAVLYWKLVRWVHGEAGREWLSRYLMRGLGS